MARLGETPGLGLASQIPAAPDMKKPAPPGRSWLFHCEVPEAAARSIGSGRALESGLGAAERAFAVLVIVQDDPQTDDQRRCQNGNSRPGNARTCVIVVIDLGGGDGGGAHNRHCRGRASRGNRGRDRHGGDQCAGNPSAENSHKLHVTAPLLVLGPYHICRTGQVPEAAITVTCRLARRTQCRRLVNKSPSIHRRLTRRWSLSGAHRGASMLQMKGCSVA